MPEPEWATTWQRYFDWIEDSEGLLLTCKRCGDELTFGTHAQLRAILAAMDDHWTSKHGYST